MYQAVEHCLLPVGTFGDVAGQDLAILLNALRCIKLVDCLRQLGMYGPSLLHHYGGVGRSELHHHSTYCCSQVKTLNAQGGGDEPEDMMAALSAAGHLDWQAKARFLILIADSPAHGRCVYVGCGRPP